MVRVPESSAASMPSVYMPLITRENVCVTMDMKAMDRHVLVRKLFKNLWHAFSCLFYREERCDVTLPWQQNFWITTIGSLIKDDGEGKENSKRSNRFILAKQQF